MCLLTQDPFIKETSQGCNKLIADQKAHLLQSPEEFLNMMSWNTLSKQESVQKTMFPLLTEIQTKITDLIAANQSLQIDVISIKTQLPISQLNSELFHLEMNGIIQSLPGKKYALI